MGVQVGRAALAGLAEPVVVRYIATLQAGYPADPAMTGRSILSAAIRTRVATRPAGNDAMGGGGPPEPSGGSVISGRGVAETAASGLAVRPAS